MEMKTSRSNKGVDILTLGPGMEVFHQGPSLGAGALPTFIYFALSGEESLTLEPINRPAANLKGENVRAFSVTLPFHGDGFDPVNAMHHWAEAFERSSEFMSSFIEKTLQMISLLLQQGLIDENRFAVGGLSRGAFIAAQIAAREPKVGAFLGYSPLTDFRKLDSFHKLQNFEHTAPFDLINLIPQLIRHPVRFYIGNRDVRVKTRSAFDLIEALSNYAYEHGIRSPEAELTVFPSIGHKGHGTPPEIFDQGIEWIKSLWKLKD